MSTNSLSARVKRLLTANIHSMVGALESLAPQALLEQYLREFDDVIAQTRSELAFQEAAKHQATRAISRFYADIEKLTEQVGIALEKNDEAAARAGAEKQLDLEDQISRLNSTLQEIIIKANSAESDLLGLRTKRGEMEQALQEMIASCAANAGSVSSADTHHTQQAAARAEQLENEFGRTLAKVSGVNALSGASEVDPMQLKKLETLQREQRISERLARLKVAHDESCDNKE